MNELSIVSGKLQLLSIIGDPIAQVSAPLMINAALQVKNIPDTLMVPFHVNPGGLQNAVNGLRYIQNFRGGIITMPHKKQTLSLLDSASDAARATGGCNVIRRDTNGMLHGDMLDGEGFALSLLTRDINVEGKKVYLAGTGGAGCAIAYAMAARQVKELIIYNRTMDKSTELIKKLSSRYPDVNIYAGSNVPEQVDIAINATSVGMGENKSLPFSLEKLGSTTTICDIVIFPEKTPLLRLAEQHNLSIHTGRSMLAAQIELMLDFILHKDS
ncbi:shikimate dehydrogenase [Rouxiella badensis]|uniref:shikimate dehydrogenase family protein n=1 Tax=Rouxiella badensis TaxID=1646377 RepID=UPI001D14B190|nr:shikimate dehydrogenase [Rouxiella badensis]MCC3721394.1 shikimate dehydrogenase [Rouxiella badensis]MCC3731089.1 shikimate dehydrogenase [Rouxiella badensis]